VVQILRDGLRYCVKHSFRVDATTLR
jgi:hypothetical protein